MENPSAVHLQTQGDVRASGWAAEGRDNDGHLMSSHAPFEEDYDIIWYIREAMAAGYTVTIWPHEIANPTDDEDLLLELSPTKAGGE